ncbi:hypothetical protein BGZ97_000500 [Linnemannia gamsii]|uniref:Uncharacterized protein n=1 Tax=Linnemannia gamsii TaxID=64522 RepID=A0A9P6R0P8_9FUNG|nr:hypothetical protein BGZ97_000500 [Linnemannia gamsii]
MRSAFLSVFATLVLSTLVQIQAARCSGGSLTLANGANLVCNNCAITNVSGRTMTTTGPERLNALKECALKPLSTGECYYINGHLYCPFPCSKC